MQLIINYIEKALRNQVEKEYGPTFISIPFNIPPDPKLGDLSSALPRILAKLTNKPLAEINIIPDCELIDEAWTEGGYLNMRLSWHKAAKLIANFDPLTFQTEAVDEVRGKKILIEHTSVNPNKPLHVGHLRNSVLGDALSSSLSMLGAKTTVANYIDDTGIQMAQVYWGIFRLIDPTIESFELTWQELTAKRDFLTNKQGEQSLSVRLAQIYSEASSQYENNSEAKKEMDLIHKKIEALDNNIATNNRQIATRVLAEQLSTTSRLGIKYDLQTWESDLLGTGLVKQTIDELKAKKIIELREDGIHKGCWVLASTSSRAEDDKVIIKSNGTMTYTGKDIAYQLWKFNYWQDNQNDFMLTINVIDDRQSYVQEVVRQAMDRLEQKPKQFRHIAYQVVTLSKSTYESVSGKTSTKDFEAMKGRAGIGVNADDLMSTIKKSVRIEDESKSNALINATIRAYLLRYSSRQMIVFDASDALRIDGETGMYICYSYARSCELLKKINNEPKLNRELLEVHAQNLLKTLANIELAFDKLASDLDPQSLMRQCFDICGAFNSYYTNTPKIIAMPEAAQAHHKAIIGLFISQLTLLMDALGLPKIEKI